MLLNQSVLFRLLQRSWLEAKELRKLDLIFLVVLAALSFIYKHFWGGGIMLKDWTNLIPFLWVAVIFIAWFLIKARKSIHADDIENWEAYRPRIPENTQRPPKPSRRNLNWTTIGSITVMVALASWSNYLIVSKKTMPDGSSNLSLDALIVRAQYGRSVMNGVVAWDDAYTELLVEIANTSSEALENVDLEIRFDTEIRAIGGSETFPTGIKITPVTPPGSPKAIVIEGKDLEGRPGDILVSGHPINCEAYRIYLQRFLAKSTMKLKVWTVSSNPSVAVNGKLMMPSRMWANRRDPRILTISGVIEKIDENGNRSQQKIQLGGSFSEALLR